MKIQSFNKWCHWLVNLLFMMLLLKFLSPFTKTFMISLVYKMLWHFLGISKQMLIVPKSNVANFERVDILIQVMLETKPNSSCLLFSFVLFCSLVSSLKFWLRFRLYFHLWNGIWPFGFSYVLVVPFFFFFGQPPSLPVFLY